MQRYTDDQHCACAARDPCNVRIVAGSIVLLAVRNCMAAAFRFPLNGQPGNLDG